MATREEIVHALYEAAELEHNLMCTYLYAAFSLKDGEADGLTGAEAEAVVRWRRAIHKVAFEEMGHLVAVWNITASLGASPRFNRDNFPLTPGVTPASLVVKLAPFTPAVVQHFTHLERPSDSTEPEGEGFVPEIRFSRGVTQTRLTPMGMDYETVGEFYAALDRNLRAFVEQIGESQVFRGDPALQISAADIPQLGGAKPVICLKTAHLAFEAIVSQGEGAPGHSQGSHYQQFIAIREELAAMRAANPGFEPAFPAATNPLLRPPVISQGRVWIENEEAAKTVDLANSAYQLMLRLLAYAYLVPRTSPEKRLVLDLSQGLMRALTPLAERAARLPAGPSHPGCNAGVSFTALRDAAPFPPGRAAQEYFVERLAQLAEAAASLDTGDRRTATARRILEDLHVRASRRFTEAPPPAPAPPPVAPPPAPAGSPPPPEALGNGVERIPGARLNVIYEGKRCIHARFCVTGTPTVFLANVKGPWIYPDTVPAEKLVEIAHACPSGAIRYEGKDGIPPEVAPPVNLIGIRENGPYAVRAEIVLDGQPTGFRATLCRCGASRNKPFCDGSHHAIDFVATGEPLTDSADMLAVRNGPLEIDPQLDGPLQVRGNLEITSGTGRVVARVQSARLCRCGGSNNKPFCDGTHAKNGFRST